MQQGLRRLMALAAVFAVAFGAVYLIRNGRDGLNRLWAGGGSGSQEFRPERYTLSDRAPLDLGDVELLARLDAEYAKLTEAVVPSVVSIDTAGTRDERLLDGYGRLLSRRVPTQGQGSGVIVSQEGHVITNHHVVSAQKQIQITLHDGKSFPATVIGDDPLLDIAVLKIEAPEGQKFQPLKLGDSSLVRRGQIVFAIGNPFGLGETITQGIISAVERSLSDTQRDLFQTDAAINPGNSGGPLVNLQGEIIGINSAIYTPDRANPGFQGVGFSIPANDVRDTLLSILERGRPIRGYLGVRMLEGRDGMIVAVGPASPAEKAGLLPGDIIESFDGREIENTTQLLDLVQRTRVGRKVPLRVIRNGQEMSLEATIEESGTAPMELPAAVQSRIRDAGEIIATVGIQARDLYPRERMSGFAGVVVTAVEKAGLAAGHVNVGDLVVGVNESRVTSAEEFYLYLSASAAVQNTKLHVIRGGRHLVPSLPGLPRREEAAQVPGAEEKAPEGVPER